jgi:hypothetical protein
LTKGTKNFLNYIIGPILFIWLTWSIYQQIQKQTDLQKSWQFIVNAFNGPNNWLIVLVGLLMLVNLGMEARKWQLQVRGIETLSFFQAYKAVMAGQAVGLNTINRIGESAARAAYLQEGNKIRGIMLSIVGSMAQMIATYGMSVLFLIYMRLYILHEGKQIEGLSNFWLNGLIYAIAMGILLFTMAYFKISVLIQLVEKIAIFRKYKFFLEKLEDFHWKTLVHILWLSIIRYFVILTQYYLLLQVFDISLFWLDAFALTGVMLLVLGIIPSIAFAELGLRGKVSLLLFGLVTTNDVGIISTAVGIWLINLILPSIVGTLFILGIRIFRNK